ncbi:hypothetical protein Mal15_17840 [Stieleria maiorica]|uniref:Uncharacterized protein n=2 Tax=Stieleria maiorica TaxID=2795974 RepID=A0A5B9MCK3_9BACT|nr:hypothetical protein Mal15_17840 [Stieleria maiorica]
MRRDQFDPLTIDYINSLAKALVCRRILGVGKRNLAEHCDVCDQTTRCDHCRHIRSKERSAHRAAGVQYRSRELAFHTILTTPASRSASDEIKNVKFIAAAKERLISEIRKASRRKTQQFPLIEYVVGIHCKRTADSKYLSCHLHLVLRTAAGCDVPTFRFSIDDLWRELTVKEFGLSAHTTWPVPGFRINNAKKRRGRSITSTRYANLLAYPMRTAENDDTPEVVARREWLFQTAGISNTYSGSNSTNGQYEQPTKASFDPVKLGKKSIIVYHMDGLPEQMRTSLFYEQRDSIRAEAKEVVMNALPSEIQHAWETYVWNTSAPSSTVPV